MVSSIITAKIGVLIISDLKLRNTFSSQQVLLNSYSTPCRLNHNKNGGVLFYVTQDLTQFY